MVYCWDFICENDHGGDENYMLSILMQMSIIMSRLLYVDFDVENC